MYCKKCGKELKATDRFCSGCGARVDVNDSFATMAAGIDEKPEPPKNPSRKFHLDELSWDLDGYPTESDQSSTTSTKFNWSSVVDDRDREIAGYRLPAEPPRRQTQPEPVKPKTPEKPAYGPAHTELDWNSGSTMRVERKNKSGFDDFLFEYENDRKGEGSRFQPEFMSGSANYKEPEASPENPWGSDLKKVISDAAISGVSPVQKPEPKETAVKADAPAPAIPEVPAPLRAEAPSEDPVEASRRKIDKFYTFNKKNEEFQALLDQEYERLRARIREEAKAEEELAAKQAKLDAMKAAEELEKQAALEAEKLAAFEAERAALEAERAAFEAEKAALEAEKLAAAAAATVVVETPKFEAVPEPELVFESETEAESELTGEPEVITEPEPEIETEPEVITEPEPEIETEPEVITEPEPEIENPAVTRVAAAPQAETIDLVLNELPDAQTSEPEPAPVEAEPAAAEPEAAGEAEPEAETKAESEAAEEEEEKQEEKRGLFGRRSRRARFEEDEDDEDEEDEDEEEEEEPRRKRRGRKEKEAERDNRFGDIFDEEDEDDDVDYETGRKKGRVKLFLLDLLILILAVCVVCAAILVFAEGTPIAQKLQSGIDKVVSLITGDKDSGEAVPVDEESYTAAAIESQKSRNVNIDEIAEDTALKFSADRDYGISDIMSYGVFEDSVFHDNVNYSDEVIGTIIEYYSKLLDRMNSNDQGVLELIVPGSQLYGGVSAITADPAIQYDITKLQIGEVREKDQNFYVLVRATQTSTGVTDPAISTQVVHLTVDGNKVYINDIVDAK